LLSDDSSDDDDDNEEEVLMLDLQLVEETRGGDSYGRGG
jgi:hypothetical protein